MSQILLREASDLLEKLFSERIPLRAVFASPSRALISLPGFVSSATRETGLLIAGSGPPFDLSKGYIRVWPFDLECEFEYGDKREFPEEAGLFPDPAEGDSGLLIRFLDSEERLALLFTL